jgi:hypothetical protein
VSDGIRSRPAVGGCACPLRVRNRRRGVGVGVPQRRLVALLAMFMRVVGWTFTKAADVVADLVGKVDQLVSEDDRGRLSPRSAWATCVGTWPWITASRPPRTSWPSTGHSSLAASAQQRRDGTG